MPQTPSPPQRWRALTDLTIEPRGEAPLHFTAGDEVVGTPEGWPKKAIIDQGWVKEITDDNTPDPGSPTRPGRG